MHPFNKHERVLKGKKKGKKRAALLVPFDNWSNKNQTAAQQIRTRLEHAHRDTSKTCSCAMCGNPRKYFNEPTIQEQKSNDILEEELNDEEI